MNNVLERETNHCYCSYKIDCAAEKRKGYQVKSDHKWFDTYKFTDFCVNKGIKHPFSAPITPQQNEIAQCKNRTLQEMTRIIIHAKEVPSYFWDEAMKRTCYIINQVNLRLGTENFFYEVWSRRKSLVKCFHIFENLLYFVWHGISTETGYL